MSDWSSVTETLSGEEKRKEDLTIQVFYNPFIMRETHVIRTYLPDAIARNSKDGRNIYVDWLLPSALLKSIVARELIFHVLFYQLHYDLSEAEVIATEIEKKVVAELGYNIEAYLEWCKTVLERIIQREPKLANPSDVIPYDQLKEAVVSNSNFTLVSNQLDDGKIQVIIVLNLSEANIDFLDWALALFKKKGLVMNTKQTPFDLPYVPGKTEK